MVDKFIKELIIPMILVGTYMTSLFLILLSFENAPEQAYISNKQEIKKASTFAHSDSAKYKKVLRAMNRYHQEK